MSDQGTQLTTPVGRIVWGDPTKAKAKVSQETRQPILKDGQPVMEWVFGLAIPTAEFQQHVWPAMAAEAAKGFPAGVPGQFSWKITQEHEIDPQGKPYGQREGYAGCVVLTCATTLQAPQIVKWEGNAYRQLQPNEIKCGDYVQVLLNLKVNVPQQRTHTPSLYVNPLSINLVGYGQPIASGAFAVDPTQAFGAGPVALPPGASATPMAPSGAVGMPGQMPQQGGMPGMPGQMPMQQPQMQPQGMPGQMPPQGGMPVQQPSQPYAPPAQQMPPPATDFIPGAPPMQQPQGMPMQQPQGMPMQQPQGMPMQQPMPGNGMPGQMPQR